MFERFVVPELVFEYIPLQSLSILYYILRRYLPTVDIYGGGSSSSSSIILLYFHHIVVHLRHPFVYPLPHTLTPYYTLYITNPKSVT